MFLMLCEQNIFALKFETESIQMNSSVNHVQYYQKKVKLFESLFVIKNHKLLTKY